MLEMSEQIRPYFRYYAAKYPVEKGTKGEIIIIPVMDGSAGLDHYFIKPLLDNGYEYIFNALLKEIYMIKRYEQKGAEK